MFYFDDIERYLPRKVMNQISCRINILNDHSDRVHTPECIVDFIQESSVKKL